MTVSQNKRFKWTPESPNIIDKNIEDKVENYMSYQEPRKSQPQWEMTIY